IGRRVDVAGAFSAGADRVRTAYRIARADGADWRECGESDGVRPADRLDAARHAGASVSGKRRNAIPRVGHAVEGVGERFWGARYAARGGGVRLARGAAPRLRRKTHSALPRAGQGVEGVGERFWGAGYAARGGGVRLARGAAPRRRGSAEHTAELQALRHLVCRPLL